MLLAVLLALAVTVPGSLTAATAGTTGPAHDRTAGTVRTDTLWSQSLGTRKAVVTYLPPSYAARPDRRYPVAVYLHGLYGNQRNWVDHGGMARTMDSLVAAGMPEMIVVMPDGDDGWYTTWNTLPNVAACRREPPAREAAADYCVAWPHYDDYIARDLVAWVDSTFRTRAQPAHRGIGGLSMGGYGAVTLALNYPDVFSAAASHSGTLSPLLTGPRPYAPPPRYAATEAEMATLWGRGWPLLRPAFGRDTLGWWARDPGRMAGRALRRTPARMPALFLDAGVDDPLLGQTRDFHATLTRLGVPHAYAERPGAHNWAYWSAQLPASLRWMAGQLEP